MNTLKSPCRKYTVASIFILAFVTYFTFANNNTVYSAGNESTVQTGAHLNVRDFGAKGDGINDDSPAFQRAMDAASSRGVPLLIPASDSPYLISRALRISSNTHIRGYGATLFMPSVPNPTNLFWSNPRSPISNVSIKGLTLKSVNDRQGTGYHANSLTSNVQGIYFKGVDNLQLRDITMHNMYTGFKTSWGANGEWNRNITVNNLQVYNAGTALLVHSTENFVMTNSILCAGAGTTRWLHSAYLSGDTRNFLFKNVSFINSPGGGITIGNGYPEKAAPQNIIFRNCIVDNARTAVNIFSGSRDITISGLEITNYSAAFNMWDSSEVSISDVSISGQTQAFPDFRFGFTLNNMSDSNISDITIDGARMTGLLFSMAGTNTNINISSINAYNLNDNSFMFANVGSLLRKVIVENSTVQWNSTTMNRISLRGQGSNAIFRNNAFINKGREVASVSWNSSGTNVLLENNSFIGFASLAHPRDHARSSNNIRLARAN